MKYFRVETAENKRKCTVCGRAIKKGEKCVSFHCGAGMYAVHGNVCIDCETKFHEELNTKEEK